jgi:hypothetical protein
MKEQLKNLVRKNVDVNKHDRLSNITLRHRFNMNSDNTSQCLSGLNTTCVSKILFDDEEISLSRSLPPLPRDDFKVSSIW